MELKPKYIIRDHGAHIWDLAFSTYGDLYASSSGDKTVRLWKSTSSKSIVVLDEFLSTPISLSWSPDGKSLAVMEKSRKLTVFAIITSKGSERDIFKKTIEYEFDQKINVKELAKRDSSRYFNPMIDWANLDNTITALLEHNILAKYSVVSTQVKYTQLSGANNCIKHSKDGMFIALGTSSGQILILGSSDFSLVGPLIGHSLDILDIDWSSDSKMLVSSSRDETIIVWDTIHLRSVAYLEGHTNIVFSVRFTPKTNFIVSKSADGTIKIWRVGSWDTVKTLKESHYLSYKGISICPNTSRIISKGTTDTAIKVWDFDEEAYLKLSVSSDTKRYVNARIVLTGDTGVGKSGLALALTGKEFEATESTHSRKVWTFENLEVISEDGIKETREILLWDLAGQPGYRLIHQLHLSEVTIGIIVFDSKNEVDPLAGVRHWNRALQQAQRISNYQMPITKVLVAARIDRGRISISRNRILDKVAKLGISRYIETSSKEGLGIEELVSSLKSLIQWDVLPRVSSNLVFQSIKQFLTHEKQKSSILATKEELYAKYLSSDYYSKTDTNPRDEFETCLKLVESRGLLKRLSFGGFVLLQPELLDAYASSMIEAAKGEPDGLGSILESSAKNADFFIPEEIRIMDSDVESVLCLATVEDLLRYEIAIRQNSDNGTYLVFPTQFMVDWEESDERPDESIRFKFEGPVLSIYARLVVRLTYSGIFFKKEMRKNLCTFFSTDENETFGLELISENEGIGVLSLFFENCNNPQSKFQFEEYIHAHLNRHSIPSSIEKHEVYKCSECGEEVPPRAIQVRKMKSINFVNCPYCDTRIDIGELEEKNSLESARLISEIDNLADENRNIAIANSVIQGKRKVGDFDVFISYRSDDRFMVKNIAENLENKGILPWMDIKELRPGKHWMREFEEIIDNVKCAAVFIGKSRLTADQKKSIEAMRSVGVRRKELELEKKKMLNSNLDLGPWQDLEVEALLRQFVQRGIPVIPVILSDVVGTPRLPTFLQGMHFVDFRNNTPDPMKSLIWGITGSRN